MLFSNSNQRLAEDVYYSRFHALSTQDRARVTNWHAQGRASESVFNGFTNAWMAFNAWASSVTEMRRDYNIVGSLARNLEAVHAFAQLYATPRFRSSSDAFGALWPIFEVKGARRYGLGPDVIRRDQIDHYLANNVTEFQPQCWTLHRDAGIPVPNDWPHTLAAIYRVRNNLIHGDKELDSKSDEIIVSAAFDVLSACLDSLTAITRP